MDRRLTHLGVCEETNNGWQLKSHVDVRALLYRWDSRGQAFRATTLAAAMAAVTPAEATAYMAANPQAGPGAQSRLYKCPKRQLVKDPSSGRDGDKFSLDHISSVVKQWASGFNGGPPGSDSDQTARLDFFNDVTNLRPMCKSCNSSLGGGGGYGRNVGASFRGPGDPP